MEKVIPLGIEEQLYKHGLKLILWRSRRLNYVYSLLKVQKNKSYYSLT